MAGLYNNLHNLYPVQKTLRFELIPQGKTKENMGNFYCDLVRIITRILIPFSIIGGLLLVWQGVPQNLLENIRGNN